MDILKELSELYNYNYEDIVPNFNLNIKQKIPSPKILIEKYFSNYKQEKSYSLTFNI